MTAAVRPAEIRQNEKHPEARGFLFAVYHELTSKDLAFPHSSWPTFSCTTGAGARKGRAGPLLIRHGSACWMTERRCRALWLSGLDPDGRRRGEQRKDGAKFVIKADFQPSSLTTPSAPASSNSSLPLKSGWGCHNGESPNHLRAGREATADKDPGPNYAAFTFQTWATHTLIRTCWEVLS